jgi:hypothetical protein
MGQQSEAGHPTSLLEALGQAKNQERGMSSKKVLTGLVLSSLFFLTALSGFAQEVDSAVVAGTVLDSSRAAVSDAIVTLTHIATNASTEVHTNERGEYRTPPLRLGEYQVSVVAPGFKRFNQRGVVLDIGDVKEVDAILEIGEVSQSVTVNEAAPLLQTQDSTVGTVVTNQQITELPLNGRNYQQLAILAVGAVPPASGGVGLGVGGQASGQVAYLLDGQDNNNQGMSPSGNAGQKDIVEPSIDALQEFKVITNGYSAEYGRSSSGVISAAIKSGTNQFHGEGYEFFRNAALDAKNLFTPAGAAKPQFGRNQFGGAIGGPVVHNKTFFFADAEIGLIRESYTSTSTLPTSSEHNGQFPTPIYDPFTGAAFPIVNGLYTIPGNMIDPIAARIMTLLPTPQTLGTTNNYTYASPEDTNAQRWDIRVDQVLTDKDNLYFRFSSDQAQLGVTSLLPPDPGEGYYSNGPASSKTGDQVVNGQSFVLGYNKVWSTNVVSSIRAGWNYLYWNNTMPSQNIDGLGIPGVAQLPGFADIVINGLPALGVTNVPNTDESQNRQISGDVTWNKGSHNLKFGIQAYWLQTNFYSSQLANGQFNFNGEYTSDSSNKAYADNPNAKSLTFTNASIADFLLGYQSSSSLSTWAQLNFRIPETHFFVQDDWKVNRKLMLNLGLRYELTPPPVDQFNGIANFEMNTDPYVGTPQLVDAGQNGNSVSDRALLDPHYNQFAPRIGFALSLEDKTVIRGGSGIFYSNFITEGGMSSMEKNPPYSVVVNPSPAKGIPTLFLQNGFAAGSLTVAGATNVQLVSFDQRNLTPTDYQWNLNIQRQLPKGILLEVGYNGNYFDHGLWQIDGNPAPPGPGAINSRRIFTSTIVPGTDDTISLANIKRFQDYAYSRYDSLQAKVEKRYGNGLSFIAWYVFSKTMALGDASGLQNPSNWAAEYAVSSQDQPHHFVGSAVYELPFGRGKEFGANWNRVTNAALGGWAIDPIVTVTSGSPVNLTVNGEPANTGQNDRPNVVGNWQLSNPTVSEWFNTAAFVANAPYTYGNAGRNIIFGPGLFNIDFAAHKSFQFGERISTQLRLEAFNLTNTPPLGNPNTTVGSSLFGQITTAGNPRQIQLGLKVLF